MNTIKLIRKGLSVRVVLWFTKWWWKYLLETPRGSDEDYCSKWERFWCRAAGHPSGVRWYSHGCEPDMRCKNCGDNLG